MHFCFYVSQKAIKCPKPQLPPFVSINPDKQEYAYNEPVTFGCPIGYTLNGEKVKDCLHSADLTENLPSCTGISKKLVCHLYLQRALSQMVCIFEILLSLNVNEQVLHVI